MSVVAREDAAMGTAPVVALLSQLGIQRALIVQCEGESLGARLIRSGY